jgi:hypothetical protein
MSDKIKIKPNTSRQLLRPIRLQRVDSRGSLFVGKELIGKEVLVVVLEPKKPDDLEYVVT